MTHRGGQTSRLARIVCALALILAGLAHKPPALAAAVPMSELAAYVLPDGTVPFLCDIDHSQDHGQDTAHDRLRCDACLLSGSALPPSPPALKEPPLRPVEKLLPRSLIEGPATALRINTAPRGPPDVSRA
ncbi:hypothetical protein NOF55_06970 [Rhizobiaceae bacterium BDR2-2]|uniref:DUF2946 domain-containing protein n=1 Tax=Ectorhizobium quercum TaxID=2965071 RepID=A0AAE3N118_9HYPH|nr:hypothetical protein [Ectorhizobium quercum]MCX8996842.1 hypothetical protein [Ectorhizobium quercum]